MAFGLFILSSCDDGRSDMTKEELLSSYAEVQPELAVEDQEGDFIPRKIEIVSFSDNSMTAGRQNPINTIFYVDSEGDFRIEESGRVGSNAENLRKFETITIGIRKDDGSYDIYYSNDTESFEKNDKNSSRGHTVFGYFTFYVLRTPIENLEKFDYSYDQENDVYVLHHDLSMENQSSSNEEIYDIYFNPETNYPVGNTAVRKWTKPGTDIVDEVHEESTVDYSWDEDIVAPSME